ncbi:MAG TPA: BatA domain-containing protein [Gemmataceae bacterium]|nr:BatA domain-containing protein [Gemmataceae bacterium]
MEALFTHPLTMAAGAALVSAPIIIHLINRMRFRRVRWAAMEFLLKAQKKMRRKMILEQLLLLILRCLLVFLAGVLFARFLGFTPFKGQENRATAHVVILDDTPSMGELGQTNEGQQIVPFDEGRKFVAEKLAPAIAQASTPQSVQMLRLTDLANPREFERVNNASIEEMRSYMGGLKPSAVHAKLSEGLKRAKAMLDEKSDKEVAKVIHVVTDLRGADWATDGDTVRQIMTDLTSSNIQVHLIDVAAPYRKESEKQPITTNNVGIVEFRPRARVAAKNQPIEFEVRLKNFGTTELKSTDVQFYLNGTGNVIPTMSFPSLPPNQERMQLLQVQFERTGTKDNPLERFNLVTAVIAAAEGGGIAADNVRHAVVEVRDRLRVLVVEGRPQMRADKAGDGFYLRKLFQDAFGGITWVDGVPRDIEVQDLRQYSAVYMLNVPGLSEVAVKNLEAYVGEGGGLGVFLGPDVKPVDYNRFLYKDGNGVMPVPLPDQPTPPPTEEQKFKRFLVLSNRVLLRDAGNRTHPALTGLYTNERGAAVKDTEVEKFFRFLDIDQYWPIRRLGKWRDDKLVQELYCMPNEQAVGDFQGAVDRQTNALRTAAGEPKFEKYRKYLDPLREKIRTIAAGRFPDGGGTGDASPPLTLLAMYVDRLLCDQINDGDESEPVLREFWAQPEVAGLRVEWQRLRDSVKFGDPLYFAKQFGRGRVTLMTTTAGEQWTNWPSGGGAPGWVAICKEMQNYLSGGGAESNLTVGSPLTQTLDATRYGPTVTRTLITADPAKGEGKGAIPVATTPLGTQTLTGKDGVMPMTFSEAKVPGVYLFTLTQLKGPNDPPTTPAERPDYVAHAFNIDTKAEGELRRVDRDDVTQVAKELPVHSPDDSRWLDRLKQKPADLSTNRWLYLIILLVLIGEQALAVRLSYHTRQNDLEMHAPTVAAAVAKGAPTTAAPSAA